MNRMRQVGLAFLAGAIAVATAACGGSASHGEAAYGGSPGTAEVTSTGSAKGGDFEGSPVAQSAPGQPPPPAARMESGGAAADSAAPRAAEMERPSSEPADRPGLGTEWGETRRSSITTVPFVRADPTQPIATAAMFYNDAEGARAMASSAGFQRTAGGAVTGGSGLVSVGLRDEHGGFLPGFIAGGRNYVIGEAGRRYSIVIRNRTQNRLEIVVSVDGLDVIDGRPAAFSKRGYLVDPQSELEIDGFRQSMDTVAAFRFGSVRGSYAQQKHGDSRNVGVIGVAIFHERGTNPAPWSPHEVQRRQDANPFPGQFATPP
ncbi:MAG: hypothetical protein L6Q76_07295 [Polyangiaceae bacterium]|nr:hypothetical protein [Polyangiaceae bacterium]